MQGKFRGFLQGAEGSVMVLTALGLVSFLGFASLAIDMGHLYVVRNELQNTADAAALTGAANLIKDESGVAVRDSALSSQKIMEVAQRQSELLGLPPVAPGARDDLTYSFGKWDIYAGDPATAWTDMGTSVPPTSTANGVKVTIRRASGHAFGPATNFLAGIFGRPTSEVVATATAFLGYTQAGEIGSVTLPLAIPDNALTAMNPDAQKSWWAKLLGPSEAIATTTRTLTFKDLGSDTFYQSNLGKPLFDTQKAYMVVVNSSDPVPGTINNNLAKQYSSGGTPVRAMARGTRLYPLSEYQWASNVKTIFDNFKKAYDAKKDANGKWRALVPVYSTTNPTASRLDQGLKKLAKWFSFGPSPAYACFTFWNQGYPGGNVPIYVDGFANVDVTNVTYTSTCNPCNPYTGYSSAVDCMVNNPASCRNTNSVTVQVPLDFGTVSPPGTHSGGLDNKDLSPGGTGTENAGAIAAIPRLVK